MTAEVLVPTSITVYLFRDLFLFMGICVCVFVCYLCVDACEGQRGKGSWWR